MAQRTNVHFPGTLLSDHCWSAEPFLQNQGTQGPWNRLDFCQAWDRAAGQSHESSAQK